MEGFPQQTTETSMKEIILRMVNAHQGIKEVDLALKVMGEVNPVIFKMDEYWTNLSALLEDGDVMELEYTLPESSNRIQSLYFPKGTTIGTPNVKQEGRILEWRDAEANRV